MKKIVYSPDYKEKLVDLRRNLDFRFGEDVRKRVMKALDARIKMLGTYENMGISIRANYGVDCDYLCIYAEKNYIFYTVDEDFIYIVNLYNEREDFMQKMFGIRATSQETEDYWGE